MSLWKYQDTNDEAAEDNQKENYARVNMCTAKALKRYLRKQKQPQVFMAFPEKADETTEEKVEGVQISLDIQKIKRKGLPEEI